MKRLAKYIIADSLYRHSAIIFISSVVANIFNLVFWFFMVRRLSPVEYGELNSLISTMLIFSVPTSVLMTVVTRYVSKYIANNENEQVKALMFFFFKKLLIILLLFLFIFLLFSKRIALFLHIENESELVYLIGLGTVFSVTSGLALGLLNGMQKFLDVAIINVVSSATKLIVGVVLVFLGLKVFGGLCGFVISFISILFITFFSLPDWAKRFKKGVAAITLDIKEIYTYFLPVGLCQLSFMALTNMDVILVKHFFSPLQAGYYSVAQMVGKIVLFFPGSVGLVMFPKVVDSHARNGKTKALLKKSLLAVGLMCIFTNFFAFLFPSFILRVLTGSSHQDAVPLVKYFALCMSFFALDQILMLYHLSLNKMRCVYAFVLTAILQVVLICLFHNSMTGVLLILLCCSVFLFCYGLLVSRTEHSNERS